MNTNIANKKEQDILYIMEYFYEEAFMLDREVAGETKEYLEFLNYAYGELEKNSKELSYIPTMKTFLCDSLINSDVITATLLYLNFNSLNKKDNEKTGLKVKILNMRKVV